MSEREDEQLLTHHPNQVINASDNTSGLRPSAVSDQEAVAKKKKMIKWGLIGGAIVIVVILAIVLPIVLSKNSSNPDDPPGPEPINPNPYTYNPYTINGTINNSEDQVSGYLWSEKPYNETHHSDSINNFVSTIQKAQGNLNTSLFVTYPHRIPEGPNNKFIRNISWNFALSDPSTGLLTMTDANASRYSIPDHAVNKPDPSILQKMEMLGFKLFQDRGFAWQFADVRDPKNVYVHTNDSTLVMMDKFIQMDLQLPSQRLYGLGERVREFRLSQGTWTMWARGDDSPYDDGTGGKQVYGVHPFVLVQSAKQGDFFGMWFRNSNAASPLLKFNQTTGGSTLSYITIGGQIEVVFFLHGSAKSIIQKYHNVIGKPELPPLWSLGWQQASWAYDTQADVETMVKNYDAQNIPLEAAWLDITYMDQFADFSIDTKAFPNLKDFAHRLHDNNRRLVVILDAGLSADNLENKYYKLANELDVLIKSTVNPDDKTYNGNLVMKVWPNHTVFIDWLHPNAQKIWSEGLLDLYNQVQYDGIWIDMNEATGFTDGELDLGKKTQIEGMIKRFLSEQQQPQDGADNPQDQWYTSFKQAENSTWYLPFVPGYGRNEWNLDHMALSLNATHPSNYTEYDVHNLYGLLMAEHTRAFLAYNSSYNQTDNRPFILTRSTFSGSGKYASHWLGDNWRNWTYMNYSIAGIMNMNMFGIPHVGADVCGFFGPDMDQEMCARWIQLSTFYPFARGHYNKTWKGEPLQGGTEPYNLKGAYLTIARNSIYDRYQYLRHQYTCLYETMIWGGTCFDPLFYHYPEDENTFHDIEHTFLVGSALKVSPILSPNVTDTYRAYFPEGNWTSMTNFADILTGPAWHNLTAQTTVQVHLRPGSLIPFQNNSDHSISKTNQLIHTPISIIANRDQQGKASGTLLLDGGISRSEINGGQYEYYNINVQAKTVQKTLTMGTHGTKKHIFEKLVLVNAEDLKDVDFACALNTHFEVIPMTPVYNPVDKTLTITYDAPNPGDHLRFNQWKTIQYGVHGQDLSLCVESSFQYRLIKGAKIDLSQSNQTFTLVNGNGLPDLNVSLAVVDSNMVNLKWTFVKTPDTFRKPFEVPADIIEPKAAKVGAKLSNFVEIRTTPTFAIKIKNHRDEGSVVTIEELLLTNNLNIIEYRLNTTKGDDFKGIFGLGERVQNQTFFYKDGIYSMWNRDVPMPWEDGRPAGNNVYGTHPLMVYKNSNSTWVGVFTNLAAAQDWVILNNKDTGEVNATVIAAGGVADIFFIVDSNPATIMSSYLSIVGKPVLTPQWALGWHQCRWGYNTTQALYDMVSNYTANKIPLDTAWSDIDYMYMYQDFTYDKKKFADLPTFVDSLHNHSMQYIPIIDAGIAVRQDSQSYVDGLKDDVFIKINNETLIGYVWPKDAAYPDFFNPKTNTWWQAQLSSLHDQIKFDGLWEDMNEASDFCGGTCYPEQQVSASVKYDLPYTPTGRNLEIQSIPLDGAHHGGYLELDTHSLFGTMEVSATHDWFKAQKKRTFIIERSSYAGIGKFGSRWLGDNHADRDYMAQSVLGVMAMNMYGVPMTGADICGFQGVTNPELCARWHWVGAFQPFSRNHNDYYNIPQEPYVFKNEFYEEGISYTDIMRDAILAKYSMIRYYYTNIFHLHINGGSPFYKPLFFEFPNDNNAYLNMSRNVMVGDALKVSVLPEIGATTGDFYFPAGTWCNIFKPAEDKCFVSKGEVKTLRTKAYDAYAHIRQGKIIPLQNAYEYNAKNNVTVALLQTKPVDFHVVPYNDPATEWAWYATGVYANDDGLTLNQTGSYNDYSFYISEQTAGDLGKIVMQVTVISKATEFQSKDDADCYAVNQNDYVQNIYIYNADVLRLNGNKWLGVIGYQNGKEDLLFVGTDLYDAKTRRLVIPMNNVCLTKVAYIQLEKSV